jgi:ABC-type sugar transport system substrate-binding protein
MKKSLRIAFAVVVLASAALVLQAAPTNPWPVPVPQGGISLSSPSNPWPVPVPQGGISLSSPSNPWPVPVPQGGMTAL